MLSSYSKYFKFVVLMFYVHWSCHQYYVFVPYFDSCHEIQDQTNFQNSSNYHARIINPFKFEAYFNCVVIILLSVWLMLIWLWSSDLYWYLIASNIVCMRSNAPTYIMSWRVVCIYNTQIIYLLHAFNRV